MSKRYQPASEAEMSELNHNNSGECGLRKKIKLEHEYIMEKVQYIIENIDISDDEVNKFLIIFHTLMESIDSDKTYEETDGIITHIILQIVVKINSLLRQNINSLNLSSVLKNGLKIIKQLFTKQDASSSSKTQSSSTEESTEASTSLSGSSSSSSGSSTSTSSSSSSSCGSPTSTSKTEETS